MEIISERIHHEETIYNLSFNSKQDPGWGYSFPADQLGNVDVDSLNPAARANYDAARLSNEFLAPEVESYTHRWTEPAVGRCVCGSNVELDGFTNTCSCGRDYNMSGQLLAPRSQWGWDTGESLDDILSIP